VHPDLATLPARVAEAISPGELEQATRLAGITRHLELERLRVTLELDPAPDASELCAAWGVERSVAVSPDVHQRTWWILVAGDELPDPHGTRIASERIAAGRWEIVPALAARPDGELPGVVSGASPAYDVRERGGVVRSIEIRAKAHAVRELAPSDPDARALLEAMASRHPHWRGGWTPESAATFVTVDDAAGAALVDLGDGIARAAHLSLGHDAPGAALLDALEAVARVRGFTRLRLDSSAFLHGDAVPYERYGYEVGPPYDGDADVEVWAEKELATPQASAP
jgi:hypothetical protein